MDRSLRVTSAPKGSARSPAIPAGRRVYAVGDIHGRADLLDAMAVLIAADLGARPVAGNLTVFLGDYIDRGPASAQVLERLVAGPFPTPIVTLAGNHEDLFQKMLRGVLDVTSFCANGGDATLRSYGLDPHVIRRLRPRQLDEVLRAAVPLRHRAFLDAAPTSHEVGDYFFCHAGARPGVSLDWQSEQDLMWIRAEFLNSDYDFGKMIVHGHTPVDAPEVRRNGINVDTKAFASGILTAVVLEGTDHRFIQARL